MEISDTILVTGGAGLVGTNLRRRLSEAGYQSVLSLDYADCDLMERGQVDAYFEAHKPAYVFHMAGRVRGLGGNMNWQGPAYLDNVLINTHVIEACRKYGVKKIVAMGTVAMYPHPLPCNPLREDAIWMGPPHHSEFGYAQAKRGMLAQLIAYEENYGLPFAVALSTNLYGPYDRFDTETGHVIPSLVKKFYDARKNGGEVVIWGDGAAERDFLYIEDAVNALILMMKSASGIVNMATGKTQSIKQAVSILADLTGMQEHVRWDASKPNGQLTRAYDISKLSSLGFSCAFDLPQGLKNTLAWYDANESSARRE